VELKPIELVSLAGLLHDIGKLRQRAQEKITNPYNEEYAKYSDNHLSYVHAVHTAEFLDTFIKYFNINTSSDKDNLINIASYHHKDIDDNLHKIVRFADRLASGFERTSSIDEQNYKKARLVSIFSSIKTSSKYEPPKTYWPIKKLSYDIVPQLDPEESEEAYKKLYKEFLEDIKKVKADNFDIFFDGLSCVLEQYLWCVPSSSYHTKADISLYNHLKVSAAFAAALYRYFEAANHIPDLHDETKAFVLIQGDFSGIQKFIFSTQGESNKFAAKILRARSFFVSLSTDIVAYSLCKALGLTRASIVMNAGGKFTILGAYIDGIEQKIQEVLKTVNGEFWRMSFGQTQFAIDYIALSPKDFMSAQNDDSFAQRFEELTLNLEAAKLNPNFDSYVFDDYLKSVRESAHICKICGMHPAKHNIDNTPICEYCNRMKHIGERLVSSSKFSITKEDGIPIFGGYCLNFDKTNNALLTFDIDFEKGFCGYAKSKISTYVPRLEEGFRNNKLYEEIKEDLEGLKAHDIKPFSCIAKDALRLEGKEAVGSDFLGILKADVDNLGYIFAKGFDKLTFSKLANLSFMMDFFFTGWLQYEIRQNFKSIYTVFSGGDDLFLIGPFSQIIDLSRRIHEHLAAYTQNKDIHLSCGIYFAKDKIPVYQMAKASEDNLSKSKRTNRKNSITIFDRTLSWDEFENLLNIDMEALFKDASSSFIYSLFTYANMAEKVKNEKYETRDLMWKPLLSYNVYRNIGKNKKEKEEKKEAIREFLENITNYIEQYAGNFIVPLSNYIYRNRRKHV